MPRPRYGRPSSAPNRKPASTRASSSARRSRDRAGGVRRAIERRIVDDDRLAVARQMHVALERVDAERDRVIERRERVLGTQLRPAAVRDDDRFRERQQLERIHGILATGLYGLMSLPTTLGALREAVAAGRLPSSLRQGRTARQPDAPAARRRPAVPRHRRLRRHRRAAGRERDPLEAQLHPARPARPGEDAPAARADVACSIREIPVVAGCEIHDDPLPPLCAACRARVAAEGDDAADRLAAARAPLRREAGDAGRHDCRPDRRRRSDQGGALRPRSSATS